MKQNNFVVTINLSCATCRSRWYGNLDPKVNFAQWYCRRGKLVVIGTDMQLSKAPGCREWKL